MRRSIRSARRTRSDITSIMRSWRRKSPPTCSSAHLGWCKGAAERGEREVLALRFPSEYCTDGGRAINNFEPDWPKTLTGFAKRAYEFWQRELEPQGYKLRAQIMDFPGGVPGDVGSSCAGELCAGHCGNGLRRTMTRARSPDGRATDRRAQAATCSGRRASSPRYCSSIDPDERRNPPESLDGRFRQGTVWQIGRQRKGDLEWQRPRKQRRSTSSGVRFESRKCRCRNPARSG